MNGGRSPIAPPLVVAIDGPAGAGKSTVARALARELGIPFVDTGAMYRAAALYLTHRGVDLDDADAISVALRDLPLALERGASSAEILLDGESVEARIRTPEIATATSRAARHAELRSRLVALQRAFVARFGGVMEGRDIGTVVVPDTPFKFYLDASPQVRAARRHAEVAARGGEEALEEIARQVAERDERDSRREASPLAAAADAERISSEGLSADEVVGRLLRSIAARSVG